MANIVTRVPAHGRGALLTGGKKGNKGGTGRPPSWFRELARTKLERGALLEELAKMAKSAVLEPRDRIKAVETLLRYGVGTKDEIEQTGEVRHAVVMLPALDP